MTFRDRFVRGLARTVLRVFFRRVEIVGEENVPADGPLIFVGNHPNSLIDPFLAVAYLPRVPRFLAKATLWKNPVVRPFLALAGSIPVERQQDGGDMNRNMQMFERCHAWLAGGGVIGLFPEGISHDRPNLQPIKTGAARIALGALLDHDATDLQIVPVGLTFEDKTLFRSRVLMQIGEPLRPADLLEAARNDERAAVQTLTERIVAGLGQVTLNFASWEDARLVDQAVEIHARTGDDMPGLADIAQTFSLRQRFGAAYERLREEQPERIATLREWVADYRARLETLGLRDDQVVARYPRDSVVSYLKRRVPLLPLWLPFVMLGAVLNWIPYRIAGLVADTTRHEPDRPATYKLLTGFFLLPLTWILQGWAAGHAWGLAAGIAVGVLGPLTGWAALLFHERTESLGREIRAYTTLRTRSRDTARLLERRSRIEKEMAALLADAKPVDGDASS